MTASVRLPPMSIFERTTYATPPISATTVCERKGQEPLFGHFEENKGSWPVARLFSVIGPWVFRG